MRFGKLLGAFAALTFSGTATTISAQIVDPNESNAAGTSPSAAIDRTTLVAMAESLAGKLADHGAKNVFVVDFNKSVSEGPFSIAEDVRPTLADQFSLTLTKASHEFTVIDRRRYTTLLKQYRFQVDWENQAIDPLSVGRAVGADTVVEGEYEIAAGGLRLTLAAYRIAAIVRCISIEVGVLSWPLDDSDYLAFTQSANPPDSAPPPFWPTDLGQIRTKNQQRPKCLSCPMPPFLVDGKPGGPTGRVLLTAVVTPDGRATDIQVQVPLSPERDAQAIAAMKRWRFEPGRKTIGGRIVASEFGIWIDFKPD